MENFSSNQEEADTKVVLYASDALNAQPNKTVIVRNYSGDCCHVVTYYRSL